VGVVIVGPFCRMVVTGVGVVVMDCFRRMVVTGVGVVVVGLSCGMIVTGVGVVVVGGMVVLLALPVFMGRVVVAFVLSHLYPPSNQGYYILSNRNKNPGT